MALIEEFKTQGDFLFKNRGHLPLIIVAIGMAVFVWEVYNGNSVSNSDNPIVKYYYEICFLVGILGLAIRCHVVGHAPDRTSGRNIENQVADVVNTKGMYSVLRNPLYLGNFFMWLAVALLTMNLWFIIAFVLFYIVYYERIMYAEEAFLRNKFGEVYLNWADKTPAFIPALNKYQGVEASFNFKKILNKEKNGILALLALFWVFNLIEYSIINYQAGLDFKFELNYWFYATLAIAVYYIVLKVIKISKKKTKY